jgi:hypothetical protein
VQLRLLLLPKAHVPWLTKLKAQARKVTVRIFVWSEDELSADVLKLHVEVINGPSGAGVEGPHDRHLVLQLLVGADPELAAPRIAGSVLDAPHLGLRGTRIPAPHVGRGAHDDQRIAG